jgi:hypothetical protein
MKGPENEQGNDGNNDSGDGLDRHGYALEIRHVGYLTPGGRADWHGGEILKLLNIDLSTSHGPYSGRILP